MKFYDYQRKKTKDLGDELTANATTRTYDNKLLTGTVSLCIGKR